MNDFAQNPAANLGPEPSVDGEYIDMPFGAREMRLGTLSIHGDRAALFAALAKAQAGYQAIPRSRTVKVKSDKGDYTFDYAPLEEVLSATLPSLNEQGLALLSFMGDPDGQDTETELHTLLTHESGAFFHISEHLPHVGKAQERGSQVTYRRRYQTGCVTGTSPEFDDDGNQADGNQVQGMAQKPRRTPPAPAPKASSAPKVVEPHPHAPPAQEEATKAMSPELKATFTGPAVFNEPTVVVVDDEDPSEEDVMRIRAAFVSRGMGALKATEFVRQVTGKKREDCKRQDVLKILKALEAL